MVVALVAAAVAPAGAATYTEDACGRAGGGTAAAAGFAAQGMAGTTADECVRGGGLALALGPAADPGEWGGWRFASPPGTTIAGLTLDRRAAIAAGSEAVYALRGSAERCDAFSGCGDGVFDLPVPADALDFRLACPQAGCGAGGATVVLQRLRIALRDDVAPVVSVVAPDAGPLRRALVVTAVAADTGGGVAELELLVDGRQRAMRTLCRPPFRRPVPCPRHVRAALALTTGALREGPHMIQVAATDATGANRALSAAFGVVVDHTARSPRRRAHVVLRTARSHLHNGELLVLVARVPSSAKGRALAFEVRIGGRWRTFAVRRPGPGGRARVDHRLRRTHRRLRYAFRAVVRGGRDMTGGPRRSRVVRVLVN